MERGSKSCRKKRRAALDDSFRAPGAAFAKGHDVPAGQIMNDVGGVKRLGPISPGLPELVSYAFSVGVSQ